MTPLLTLWPSELTGTFPLKVSFAMKEAGTGGELFRAEECAALSSRELATLISADYKKMMPLDAVDTVLHTVAVLPLWEASAEKTLARLTDALPMPRPHVAAGCRAPGESAPYLRA